MLNDSFTVTGAHKLADRIRNYWHSRGFYQVQVRAEPVVWPASMENAPSGYWHVRSNLVDGMAPAAARALAA
jgi:hypothetical protein